MNNYGAVGAGGNWSMCFENDRFGGFSSLGVFGLENCGKSGEKMTVPLFDVSLDMRYSYLARGAVLALPF